MKSIELKPIKESREDYEAIQSAIFALLKEEIYRPLLKELGLHPFTIKNSTDELVDAIVRGQIRFYRGQFTGSFNATLSKELRRIGAKWDRRQGSFAIPQSKLSPELKNAIDLSEHKFVQAAKRMDAKLASMVPEDIASKLRIEKLFSRTIYRVEKDFNKSVKGITVSPQLTESTRARIAKEYTENLQLYIKDFAEKEIQALRLRVQEKTFAGERYENLTKEIEKSYGVSYSKAKFLARQETSLLMTKYKQARYQSAGVNQYKWACVKMPHQPKGGKYLKGEVRYHHAELEGKIFSWDNPPIVNVKGERKNPGQDYNCRCFAIPIVKF